MRFHHVLIDSITREFLSAEKAPMASADACYVATSIGQYERNLAPRAALELEQMGTLNRVRRVPLAAVRAPFVLAPRALVKKWVRVRLSWGRDVAAWTHFFSMFL